MNQRYQQDPSRGRQGSRAGHDDARNMQGRGERFGRPFDDDSPRSTNRMGGYESDYGPGEYASPDDYEEYAQEMGGRGYGASQEQYLGSYPTEQGPRYYESGRGGQYAGQGLQRGNFAPRAPQSR